MQTLQGRLWRGPASDGAYVALIAISNILNRPDPGPEATEPNHYWS
jgi:hypothetical protein